MDVLSEIEDEILKRLDEEGIRDQLNTGVQVIIHGLWKLHAIATPDAIHAASKEVEGAAVYVHAFVATTPAEHAVRGSTKLIGLIEDIAAAYDSGDPNALVASEVALARHLAERLSECGEPLPTRVLTAMPWCEA